MDLGAVRVDLVAVMIDLKALNAWPDVVPAEPGTLHPSGPLLLVRSSHRDD